MNIDPSQFPLVWMHYRDSAAGQTDPFVQLDRLLQREQPFVLVTADAPGEAPEQGEAAQASLKQASLWMKRNKEAIQLWIKASIVIAPDGAAQARVEAFADTYRKFWGYPLLHCASKEGAQAMVERLLGHKRVNSQNW
ncbi:hypothetical protein [Pseudomonas chlororaphis]|uniref:Uncharacterized protein n=1 Tax=Pseudomonas chlororaphis TaxID=587753 RepID=A0A1Q8ERW5_9PSED|nr:hypothetical protein [Pseudomonas chlororaphis]OLF54535.1 hypothetical protein BTN82_11050 [Pseudomonas chlororaphis]